MKYSNIFSPTAVCIMAVLVTAYGCGSLDAGQTQYSGYEQTYNRDYQTIGDPQLKVYTLNEGASTFTLSSGASIFTFTGSHPNLGDTYGKSYSGTYPGGTAIVTFVMGMHLSYHRNDDSTTFTGFDGSLM